MYVFTKRRRKPLRSKLRPLLVLGAGHRAIRDFAIKMSVLTRNPVIFASSHESDLRNRRLRSETVVMEIEDTQLAFLKLCKRYSVYCPFADHNQINRFLFSKAPKNSRGGNPAPYLSRKRPHESVVHIRYLPNSNQSVGSDIKTIDLTEKPEDGTLKRLLISLTPPPKGVCTWEQFCNREVDFGDGRVRRLLNRVEIENNTLVSYTLDPAKEGEDQRAFYFSPGTRIIF